MQRETFNKLLVSIFVVLTASAFVFMLLSLRDTSLQNRELRLAKARLDLQLKNLERENVYKEEYYFRLVHDDNFADRVIREKLGLSRAGELMFRFEDSKPVSVSGDSAEGDSKLSDAEARKAALDEEKRLIAEAKKLRGDEPEESQNVGGSSAEKGSGGALVFSSRRPLEEDDVDAKQSVAKKSAGAKSVASKISSQGISNDFVIPKRVAGVEKPKAIAETKKTATVVKKKKKKLSPEAERAVRISSRFR